MSLERKGGVRVETPIERCKVARLRMRGGVGVKLNSSEDKKVE